MKACKSLIIVALTMYPLLAAANNTERCDSIIYSQKVIRDDRMFHDMLRAKRGMLVLTNEALEFRSKRPGHARFDFSIPYNNIKYIRPFYGFIIPNRIKIKTNTGETYRLFTYKKRKIINITQAQIDAS